jgi:5-formyltetrahydrofolate cyclo-ligase
MTALSADKAEARRAAFARRAAIFAAADRAARVEAASAHLARAISASGGQALAGYMPMRSEIDPLGAMAAHRGPVGVPVIEGPARALRFRLWTPEAEMVEGAFRALIPKDGPWVIPQVLIVPLLAFDAAGYRLGYGGGFYDRTLQALRKAGPVTAIGYAFAAQEATVVPREPTDERLDAVVTEDGVRTFPEP